jgi:hypothetical protein
LTLTFENGVSLEILASGSQLRQPAGSPIPSYGALIGRDILASAILTYDGIQEKVVFQFGPHSPAADESRG